MVPIVEPEIISSPDSHSVKVFVVNLRDDAAVDVTIAPTGWDSISFGVVRILRTSDPKAEVAVFISPSVPMKFDLLNWRPPFVAAWEFVKRAHFERGHASMCWAVTTQLQSSPELDGYVPLCLTYKYSHGRSYHTHDFVLADTPNRQIVIRRKLDPETAFGASPAHA